MCNAGVPDFVNKVHTAAKMLHERRKPAGTAVEQPSGEPIPM